MQLPSRNFLDVSSFPMNRLISGGVAKDGIPALTDPGFVLAGSADAGYLLDEDLVLGVFLDGIAKAYPHNIGWHHEIVNDVVERPPPRCYVMPAHRHGNGLRRPGRGQRTAGTRRFRLLFNNNLVMYDRRFEDTLYPQMTHIGIKGFGTEQELTLMPVVETTWGNWKRLYPGTLVVGSGSDGHVPRRTLFDVPLLGLPRTGVSAHVSPVSGSGRQSHPFRYPPKEIVLGVRFGNVAKAYPSRKWETNAP